MTPVTRPIRPLVAAKPPIPAGSDPRTVVWPQQGQNGGWGSGGATVLDGQQLARLVGRHGWTLHESSQLRSPRDELDVVLHRLPLGKEQVVLHADPQVPAGRERHRRDREAVSYTHLRAHETDSYLVCRLL